MVGFPEIFLFRGLFTQDLFSVKIYDFISENIFQRTFLGVTPGPMLTYPAEIKNNIFLNSFEIH